MPVERGGKRTPGTRPERGCGASVRIPGAHMRIIDGRRTTDHRVHVHLAGGTRRQVADPGQAMPGRAA